MKQIDLHLGKICANRTSSIRANKQEMCEFDQKFQRNVISPSICQTLMWNVVGKCQHGISFWTWKNTPLKLVYFGIFSLCGRFLLCVTKYKICFSFTITFLKTFSVILSETFWQILDTSPLFSLYGPKNSLNDISVQENVVIDGKSWKHARQ